MKSLTLNSLIIVLFFASYVFAGGFEEDPGPEEVLETVTASFTDSEGNIVTWSQGLVTTGGDDKKYVVWGN